MSGATPQRLLQLLHSLLAEATLDPRLAAEMVRARREFLGEAISAREPARQAAAEARFAEWYLLERESELLGDVPARNLWRGLPELPAGRDSLLDSSVGVFLVETVGHVVRLLDLQNDQIVELQALGELHLTPGDMVVGRLYGGEHAPAVPSAALAVHPHGAGLAAAFRRDLASLDLDRRLTQLELEHLLFRRFAEAEAARADALPLEHLEAELEQTLVKSGKDDLSAADISAALGAASQPGLVMGPLLEELAFDTEVDLEVLRRLLLRIWNAHHPAVSVGPAPAVPNDAPPVPEDPGVGLGARLAQRIERGLADHEDLDSLFGDVDAMLGGDQDDPLYGEDEDAEEDDEDEDGEDPEDSNDELADGDDPEVVVAREPSTTSFDDGDLTPLVEEFLWEEGLPADSPEQAVLRRLLTQQRESPVPRANLEYLEPQDLLRLLLRTYLESAPTVRRDAVRQAWLVLERFYAWAERTQEYRLGQTLAACNQAFVKELDRLHAAGLALSTAEQPSGRPSLIRVLETMPEGCFVAVGSGSEPLELACAAAARHLHAGDLLLATLGSVTEGTATLTGFVVVLPGAVESLLG